MIYLKDIIEACRADALAGRLNPTDINDWRYFCREYSKTFHTPLHLVLEMAPASVLLPLFEEQMDKRSISNADDLEYMHEELRRLSDPNYDATEEKAMEDFVSNIEAGERERLKKGLPIPKARRKQKPQEPKLDEKQELPPDVPKQGFVDLSRFNQDEES